MPVRIGVGETGVDIRHPIVSQKRLGGIGVRREGDDYRYEPDFHDLDGHGTAMGARIRAFCETAYIHAVRIAQQGEGGVGVRV